MSASTVSTEHPTAPASPSRPAELLDLILGSITTQAVYVAADLGIADVLADGPLTAAEIAQRVDADPDAVYRLLRLLASHSVFAEENGRFALTPTGDALRSGAPRSLRGIARLMGHPIHWEDWGHLADSIRSGEPSLPKVRGMGAFEFMGANPEFGMVFGQGMESLSGLETAPVAAAYDWARFSTVVDVCGGRGALLAAVLQQAPGSRGILFEERAAEMGAEATFEAAGVADRYSIDSGGLFGPVPAGADAYLLKHAVHDWPEPQGLQILKNVRNAMGPDSRLLLMEFVVPEETVRRHLSKQVDLMLMLLVGGRERTAGQYADLLARAGLELARVIPTESSVSIIEARPVQTS